ncbi:NEAT domain-containing protein [Streptococcus iniae]|nr:NEAT domain-containing protein [Streptococcus iniae]
MKKINKYALLTLSVLALTQAPLSVKSDVSLKVSDLVSSLKVDGDIFLLEDIGPYADKQIGKEYYKTIDKLVIDNKVYDHKMDGAYTFDINYKGIKIKSNDISNGEHKLLISNPVAGDILVTFKKSGKEVTFISAQQVTSEKSSSQDLPAKSSQLNQDDNQVSDWSLSENAVLIKVSKLEKEDGALLFQEFDRYSSDESVKEFVHKISGLKLNQVDYKEAEYGSKLKGMDAWLSDLKGLHIGTKAFEEGDNTLLISSQGFEPLEIVIRKSGDDYSILSSRQKNSHLVKGIKSKELDFTTLEALIAKVQAVVEKSGDKGLADKLQVIKDSYQNIDSVDFLRKTEALLRDLLTPDKSEKVSIDTLKEGTYTLTFKANKEHTDESSMLQGAFDKKAKLVVKKDGSKEISLLNTALGAFLIDFSVETNGEFPTAVRKQVGKRDINGAYVRSEFTFSIDQLDKLHKGAVLVSAMGGQESDKHHYDKYTKLDMTFDQMVSKGFEGYQVEIDDKEKGVGSERLERALIRLGKDLNHDGKMSPDELAKMTGELRLDHYDLTDISLLKHATHITELYLVGNQISEISKDTFSQMTELKVLELQNNQLTQLDKSVFAHNKQLKKIQLASNYIATIEPEMFKNLSHLEELDLSKNRLSSIDDKAFVGLRQLKSLALPENQLEMISEQALADLENLTFIDLSENKLNQLPKSFNRLKRLTQIVADHNHLTSLDDLDFEQFSQLTTLNLSSNELTRLKTSEFKANKNLANLDLFNNLLTELKAEDFDGFNKLNLDIRMNCLHQIPENVKKLLGSNKWQPQKNLASLSIAQSGHKIDYKQTVSLLDLYYWEQKTISSTVDEITSLDQYQKVLKTDSTDIKELLNQLDTDWNILIQLQKKNSNGHYVTIDEKALSEDPDDQMTGTFDVSDKGTYRLRKVLMVKKMAKKREHFTLVSNDITINEDKVRSYQSTKNQNLDIKSLKDGVYYLKAEMLKNDLVSESMANKAINPQVKLIVENGNYFLEVAFKGMKVGHMMGYLGQLYYFTDGYQRDRSGKPTGHKELAEVISYFKDATGNPLADTYGKDYPQLLKIKLLDQAKIDGLVPLQVFVPVMDSISKGAGHQTVFMKLDLRSLTSEESDLSEQTSDTAKEFHNQASNQAFERQFSPFGGFGNGIGAFLAKKANGQAPASKDKEEKKGNTDKLKELLSDHQSSKSKIKSTSEEEKAPSQSSHKLSTVKKSRPSYHKVIGVSTFVVALLGAFLARKKLF